MRAAAAQEAEAKRALTVGFAEYVERWMEMIRTQPNRSGKKQCEGTIRAYPGPGDMIAMPLLMRQQDSSR